MTLFLAVICWLSIDKILQLSGVSRYVRRCAGLLLVSNALFLHLSLSFMTEFWGTHRPAGAALWLFERRRAEATQAPAALRLGPAIAVALIIGSSFWVRQFCILSFPALLLATVGCLLGNRQWSRLRATLPTLSVAMLAFLAVTYAYFRWAQATGKPAFGLRRPAGPVGVDTSLLLAAQVGHFLGLYGALSDAACDGGISRRRPAARPDGGVRSPLGLDGGRGVEAAHNGCPTHLHAGFLHGQFPYLQCDP